VASGPGVTTFAPDWDEIYFAYDSNYQEESGVSDMHAVITEYQRQMAEAGKVVVDQQQLDILIIAAKHAVDLLPFHSPLRLALINFGVDVDSEKPVLATRAE